MPFDTKPLHEIVACLRKGADKAKKTAENDEKRGYMTMAEESLRRYERNTSWADSLEKAIAKLETPKKKSTAKTTPRGQASDAFERFWKSYPWKDKKGDAEKAWGQMGCEPIVDEIVAAVERQKNSPQWLKDNGEYIPLPASWLRAKGWLNEGKTPPAGKVSTPPGQDPAGWREWLAGENLPYQEYRFAKSYLKTEFRDARPS